MSEDAATLLKECSLKMKALNCIIDTLDAPICEFSIHRMGAEVDETKRLVARFQQNIDGLKQDLFERLVE